MAENKTPQTPETAAPKKERPQNKHLIPLSERTPEERKAIAAKAHQAKRDKHMRENANFNRVCSVFLRMGMKGGQLTPIDDVGGLDEAQVKNISVQSYIVLTEFKRYLSTGDKESRNWLVAHGMMDLKDGMDEVSENMKQAGIDANKINVLLQLQRMGLAKELLMSVALQMGLPMPDPDEKKQEGTDANEVHIHLIRGDKAKADEGEATRGGVKIHCGSDPDDAGGDED